MEIKGYGDTVIIRQDPSITVSDYTIGGGLTYQVPTSTVVELPIDTAKSFSFQVNDIDRVQSDLNLMNRFSQAAANDLKVAVDLNCFTKVSAGIAAANKGATAGADSGNINLGAASADGSAAISLTETNIIKMLMLMNQVLDEQSAPEDGRWVVLPPWACTRALLSELKDASLAGDGTSILRNGRIGVIGNLEIYRSRNLPTVTETAVVSTKIFAGHSMGLTWASQITETESMKNPSDFGDLVRGLAVYGVKVTKGEALVELYAKQGALT
ncbi:MAG: hypothetical protein H7842_02570 [Gammaproteobacteria bacterium SHHR-1]